MAGDPRQPQKQQRPAQSPAFVQAEGQAMLQLAQTLQALVESKAYGSAANPSWWKRIFG